MTVGSGGETEVAGRAQESRRRGPYGLYVAIVALTLAAVVVVVAFAVFHGLYRQASDVTTVLASLFTLFGTVTGAYFGIKVSGDTTAKAQDAVDRAHDRANRALAVTPPELARRALGEEPISSESRPTTPDGPTT